MCTAALSLVLNLCVEGLPKCRKQEYTNSGGSTVKAKLGNLKKEFEKCLTEDAKVIY